VTETTTIDRAVFDGLLESVGGDADFMAELLQTFFDDAPQLLVQMREALTAGDAEVLRRAAHSLKSNSASFGAMGLSRMCKELEDMGKAGAFDGVAERIAQVEVEYVRVTSALQAAAGL